VAHCNCCFLLTYLLTDELLTLLNAMINPMGFLRFLLVTKNTKHGYDTRLITRNWYAVFWLIVAISYTLRKLKSRQLLHAGEIPSADTGGLRQWTTSRVIGVRLLSTPARSTDMQTATSNCDTWEAAAGQVDRCNILVQICLLRRKSRPCRRWWLMIARREKTAIPWNLSRTLTLRLTREL